MVWAYFDASGPGRLAIIDRTINYELYQQIIKENVRISVKGLSLKRKWIIQQDNDTSTQVVLPKNG